jgi:1-acyl-sn-glycerol-3-phosphate acyltransferase
MSPPLLGRFRDSGAPPTMDHALLERGIIPVARALLRVGYFDFEVEGAEHLPRDGRAVYALNHAGWFPLDAFFAGLAVTEALGQDRAPYFAASDVALAAPGLGPFLRRVGAVPASWFRRPEKLPPEIRACAIFPEGVEGNTKPFWEAYRMRPWKRGFVRVAAALDLPVVPVAILGGEESLPVAWTVRRLQPFIGSIVGLPAAPFPLPARWKIVFHEPMRLEGGHALVDDRELGFRTAARVRAVVQATLDAQAATRPLKRLSTFVEAASRLAPRLLHAARP